MRQFFDVGDICDYMSQCENVSYAGPWWQFNIKKYKISLFLTNYASNRIILFYYNNDTDSEFRVLNDPLR